MAAKRVLVYLVDGAAAAPRLAEFTECIVNSLHLEPRAGAGAGMVLCALRSTCQHSTRSDCKYLVCARRPDP